MGKSSVNTACNFPKLNEALLQEERGIKGYKPNNDVFHVRRNTFEKHVSAAPFVLSILLYVFSFRAVVLPAMKTSFKSVVALLVLNGFVLIRVLFTFFLYDALFDNPSTRTVQYSLAPGRSNTFESVPTTVLYPRVLNTVSLHGDFSNEIRVSLLVHVDGETVALITDRALREGQRTSLEKRVRVSTGSVVQYVVQGDQAEVRRLSFEYDENKDIMLLRVLYVVLTFVPSFIFLIAVFFSKTFRFVRSKMFFRRKKRNVEVIP